MYSVNGTDGPTSVANVCGKIEWWSSNGTPIREIGRPGHTPPSPSRPGTPGLRRSSAGAGMTCFPPTRQQSISGDMQRRRVVSVTMGLHDDLYILIECHQKTQKTLHRELAELPAQHLGYVGLADAQQIGHLDLFQTPLFPDRIDFEHKLRFDQMFFRIRHAEILEHVTASDFVSFAAHRSLVGAGSETEITA